MAKLFSRKPKTDPALDAFPQEMAALITHGEPTDATDYAAWAEQLQGHVPDLIRMVLDDDLNERTVDDPGVWAPFHALKVLGVLGAVEAAEPLMACFDWDDDWFQDELPGVYAAFGPETIPLLHTCLLDTSRPLGARTTASAALAAIAQLHPAARDAIVALLTEFLDRPGVDANGIEEDVTTAVISDLSELGAQSAYDAIRRAFAEDRINPAIIGLEDVERDLGMRPPLDDSRPTEPRTEPGVRLDLRCKVCGRVRQHVFPTVYFDLGTSENKKKLAKYDPLIIPQRVVCPKCGAVDQYELAGLGHMAIVASMLAEQAEREGETFTLLRPDQRVKFMHFTTQWGLMHPLEAVERYARELARKPNDVSLHERFANVLKLLGRLDEAEDHYRRAANLDPQNLESRMGLAQVAMLRQDIAEAIRWWTEAKALAPTAALPPQINRRRLMAEIDSNLANLRQGIIPEYEIAPMSSVEVEEEADEEPALMGPPRPRAERGKTAMPKVGRNDPCPCGSGKKYKHCHGRPG